VHIVGGKKLILPTLQSLLFYPPLHFFGGISITAEVYSMGLHSRSSHSVWMKPFNHKPFIVSSIVLIEDSQLTVPFTVFDPDIDFLVQSQSNIYLWAASQCCSLNLRLTCTHACYYCRDAQNSLLIINGTLHDLNMVLSGVMYQP
jgi:hypothetical protein